MLVCSVVLRPQHQTIAAAIVEVGAALDDPALGVIFATLTDAPGDARDILNAFLGQNIVEAASAAAVVNATSVHPAIVVEEISAAVATQNATLGGVVPGGVARAGVVETVFVNSPGTARQANVNGIMVNL